MLIRYRNTDRAIRVNEINGWNRGEITPQMSASSGFKENVANWVFQEFGLRPEAVRIIMVRGEYKLSPPFALFQTLSVGWIDSEGRPVEIEGEISTWTAPANATDAPTKPAPPPTSSHIT